jgi:hypothetical protein
VIDDNPIRAYKRYEIKNWAFRVMNVEPSPKYMNGELNSQIGIRGQDSHFSEVKWDFPYIHASYGVLHSVKNI